jgi:hypothetical protein
MAPVQLTVGTSRVDRLLSEAGKLLREYRKDTGYDYLDYQPVTSPDVVVPEDLAATLLVNSQSGWRAVRSLQRYGAAIDLGSLPAKPLEQTTSAERRQGARLIATRAQWPRFAASVATQKGLKLTVRVEVSEGVSPQKATETRVALRELGLDEGGLQIVEES